MLKQVKVPTTIHEVVQDANLLDIIVQEHNEQKPKPEITVKIEYQSLCCGGWATSKIRTETTVNGHLKTRPPADGERLIITKARG
jgi:hypothetical protein